MKKILFFLLISFCFSSLADSSHYGRKIISCTKKHHGPFFSLDYDAQVLMNRPRIRFRGSSNIGSGKLSNVYIRDGFLYFEKRTSMGQRFVVRFKEEARYLRTDVTDDESMEKGIGVQWYEFDGGKSAVRKLRCSHRGKERFDP